MPQSWASPSNPGLYVHAPAPERYRWSMTAPTPLPRAHYVCHCGQTNAALGTGAVKALISEYLAHQRAAHGSPAPAVREEPAPAPPVSSITPKAPVVDVPLWAA